MNPTQDVWITAELYDNPGGAEELVVWVYAADRVTKIQRYLVSPRDLGLLATGQAVLGLLDTYDTPPEDTEGH